MKISDRLDWRDGAMDLMEYIGIIESIYIPDLDDFDYKLNVIRVEASSEQIEESNDLPFGVTECMRIFYNRYNEGILTKRLSYQNFISNAVIRRLIQDLELDQDKFWLLVLFINDYCNSIFYEGTTMLDNPLEQIQKLIDAIEKSEKGSLMFNSGKLKVEVDDTHAISFIANAILKQMSELDGESARYLTRRVTADETTILKDSPIITFFAKMFLAFFNTQQQIRNKRKKGANHSFREIDLVCQLVYFTKLSTKECWLLEENDTLKAFLKQYKNYTYPHNVSSIYPEFSI